MPPATAVDSKLVSEDCESHGCIVSMMTDPEAAQYLSGYGKGWAHQVPLLLRRGVADGTMWSLRSCGEVVGVVMVEPTANPKEVTIEYLIQRGSWGKGLGRAAAAECLRLAQEAFGATACVAMVVPQNTRSVRIVEALGFALEDTVEYSMNNVDRTVRKYVKSDLPQRAEGKAAGVSQDGS
eukprot:TRINITY_DN73425_c0_g1_i1.p1 TRINITY_DN73425_c0_g1~~TRINITY_DN73425_c0_g1_i1.p1  ORF type:complete len:181 (+),score=39.39 TRINITY_DN73425_c0_g1_i1:130-672(+)